MGNSVSLVKTQNSNEISSAVSKALGLINFNPERPVKTVVIKPNLCYYWSASTGYTTDPRLVAGIIDVMRQKHGEDLDIKVVESDATAMRTKHAFQMLGYTRLAKEKKVELFNLSEDTLVERKVRVNGHELSFQVPKLLLDTDLFINVPKMKIMMRADVTITCALKNLFGCIGTPRKIVYHPHLSEAVAGISQVLKPHLTIADGLVALGRFPVKLDLIVASTDAFSVDWIVAQIMGYKPSKIKYLKIAKSENIGNTNGITVIGEPVEGFRKLFPKVSPFKSKLSFGLQLKLLKLYNRVVGDTVPSELEGA